MNEQSFPGRPWGPSPRGRRLVPNSDRRPLFLIRHQLDITIADWGWPKFIGACLLGAAWIVGFIWYFAALDAVLRATP